MFYIVNARYGGFRVPKTLREKYEVSESGFFFDNEAEDKFRTDAEAISWIFDNDKSTDLAVVDIPDEATDWELQAYDGLEHITAVVNGKIVHPHIINPFDNDEFFADDENDNGEWLEPDDLECGFDPYEGGYTYDC